MKTIGIVLFLFVTAGLIAVTGCTSSSTSPGTQTPTIAPVQATSVAAAAVNTNVGGTKDTGAVVIDESFSVNSGYQNVYKKFALEDYGYLYLYPGDTFRISVSSNKPVNVLLIGKTDEMKFDTVEPVWNTALKRDQWDYSPLVPEFSQSNVEKKDMTFTIRDKSTYFLIIDPRFSSDYAGWKSSKHDEVRGTVRLVKT